MLHREAVRYAAPLREGGSLPAVVETEGGELFVVKFRGAGQGAPALVAELVVGLLAQRLGLTVPDLAVVEVGEGFGRAEPDPEIQDILRGSHGPNVGLRFLEGAFAYDPVAFADLVTPEEAADVVWFDALTLNVDRTPRNPNILVQHRRAWLIDHGAALYLHHDWPGVTEERVRTAFERIRDHVLLPRASSIAEADERLAPRLTDDGIAEVLAAVPDTLLMDAPEGRHAPFPSAEEARAAYHRLFADRLRAPRVFAEEAERARVEVQAARPRALDYRR
ncbi:MAG TPA: HipA family kinase [Rubricoccaceae bacterium]|nr:HipA family kinase [Rubricoccaceae bacterium]